MAISHLQVNSLRTSRRGGAESRLPAEEYWILEKWINGLIPFDRQDNKVNWGGIPLKNQYAINKRNPLT